MALTITPIDCGYITQVEKSAHQYFRCFGEKTTARVILWLVTGGDFPVVVDLGPGDPSLVAERFGREYVRSAEQHPREAVRAAGVDPDAVKVVVLTHLHWDHSLGLTEDPFPNALIYLQREEIRYAASPYPPHEVLFDTALMKRMLPTHGSDFANIRLIDGDFSLFEGCLVMHTPGHTPGSQSLLVDTGELTYAIAADNVPFAENWQGLSQQDWIPSGTHVSVTDIYRTLTRLAAAADVVLPSHDPAVLDWGPFPPGGPRYRADESSPPTTTGQE